MRTAVVVALVAGCGFTGHGVSPVDGVDGGGGNDSAGGSDGDAGTTDTMDGSGAPSDPMALHLADADGKPGGSTLVLSDTVEINTSNTLRSSTLRSAPTTRSMSGPSSTAASMSPCSTSGR
jgi:hypothetical protein